MRSKSASSKMAHFAARVASKPGCRRFQKAIRRPEVVQREQLKRILVTLEGTPTAEKYGLSADMPWEEFRTSVPVTDYADWSESIEKQRSGCVGVMSQSVCERYQPTSGTTSKVKWIPYTDEFLAELDAAISPMITDMYKSYPGIGKGKHYWSFSWVPTELRTAISGDINNDLKLLPWWKRVFMAISNAVPDEVSLAETSDDSMFATLCYLLKDRELSFLSVWSPTFALTMLDGLALHRQELSEALKSGSWGKRTKSLEAVKCPVSAETAVWLRGWDGSLTAGFLHKLWPKLALISAWDTSTSAIWAKQLQSLFPHAKFQGKGLWATEGVVTIPFQGKYPLALCSHFYEFMDIETGKIYPSWGLHIGQDVRPLLTTGSGLLRYAMKDKIRVVDFLKSCPCFEFLGRMDGIDMVGEKFSPEVATTIIHQVAASSKYPIAVRPISLLALPISKLPGLELPALAAKASSDLLSAPFYLFLCEVDKDVDKTVIAKTESQLAVEIEAELQKHFHYALARDLKQLGHLQVLCADNAREEYLARGSRRGMVTGNIKVEPLVLWDGDLPEGFTPVAYATKRTVDNIHQTFVPPLNQHKQTTPIKECVDDGC